MASNEPPTNQTASPIGRPCHRGVVIRRGGGRFLLATTTIYGSAMPVITSSQRIFRKAQPLSSHAGLAAFQLAIGRQALCNGSLDCRPCPLLRDLVIMSSKIVFF